MTIGFVLIRVSPLHEAEVYKKLSEIPEIIELLGLFGEYDIIAKIEAKDYETLGQIIINKIRKIDGILFTSTLTGLKFH